MSLITIEPCKPNNPEASRLLQQSQALMQSLFPVESNHYLSIDALCMPDVRFFVARRRNVSVGCGGLKVYDDYAEVKSLFTDPAARRLGVADLLLTHLENAARTENRQYLRLETGDLLYDAHRLYTRHGFVKRGPFGDYVDDPRSIFMEKTL